MRKFFDRIDLLGTIKSVLQEFGKVFNNKDLDKVGGIISLISISVAIYKDIREAKKSEGEKAFASLLDFVLSTLHDSLKEMGDTIENKISNREARSFINEITRKFNDYALWSSFLEREWRGTLQSHPVVAEILSSLRKLLESHGYDSTDVNDLLMVVKKKMDILSTNDDRINQYYRWVNILRSAKRLENYLISVENMKEKKTELDKKALGEYYIEQEGLLLNTTKLVDKEDNEIRQENKNEIRPIQELVEEFLKEDFSSWYRAIGVPSFGIGRTSMVKMLASGLATRCLDSPEWANNFIPIVIFLNEEEPFKRVYGDLNIQDVLELIIAPNPSQKKGEILLIVDSLEGYSNKEKNLMEELEDIRNDGGSKVIYENMKALITTIYKKHILEDQKVGYNRSHIRLLSFSVPQVDQFFKNYFKGSRRQPLTYKYLKDSGLSSQEIVKPLFAWMISFIDTDLKIFNKDLDEKFKRALMYLLFLQYASRQKYQLDEEEWTQKYIAEHIVLRRIAALRKGLGTELTIQKKNGFFTIDHVLCAKDRLIQYDDLVGDIPSLALSFIGLSMRSKEQPDGTEIFTNPKFVHESFEEYLLAEYYVDSILNDRLYRLNIGVPSEVTVQFLDGLISILLADEETIRQYLEPLLESLRYRDEFDLGTLSRKIVDNCLGYLKRQDVIFFTRNKDIIKRPEMWVQAETASDDYKQLWIYRWISLFFLSKVSEANKKNKITYPTIDPDIQAEIIHLITYSGNVIPGYMKNLKTLKLNLKDADLSDAYLAHANLSYSDLSGAQFSRANLKQADLSYCNLSFIDLYRANLIYANLSHSNLRLANLQRNDLDRADLSYSDLTGVNFNLADMQRSKLIGANLSMVNLAYANLSEANLSGSLIIDVEDYQGLRCYKANFEGAIINNEKLVTYLRENGARPPVPDPLTNTQEIDQGLKNWYSNFRKSD
jgi:uncharacterized protein YjbI with pentapeptide repeats